MTDQTLTQRLLDHAAIHDAETSPYSPEQAQWAADLREAARLLSAAPAAVAQPLTDERPTLDDVLDALQVFNPARESEGVEPWAANQFIAVTALPDFIHNVGRAWYSERAHGIGAAPVAPASPDLRTLASSVLATLGQDHPREDIDLDAVGLICKIVAGGHAVGAHVPAPVAQQTATEAMVRKAERVHAIVNAGAFPGMSEAFDAHMGATCWVDQDYAPDASTWAAAWKAAKAHQATRPATLVGLSDEQMNAAWSAGFAGHSGDGPLSRTLIEHIQRALAEANGMTLREPKA